MPYYQPNAGYSTYMPQQARYEPPYAAFQQMGQVTPPTQNGFICRPVTSREEAVAVQTDFVSAGTIMPDLGHGMIYFKRFNPNTGLSDWHEFAYVQPSSEAPVQEQTDTSEIFRNLSEHLGAIDNRLAEMAEKIEAWRPKAAKKGSDAE